MTATESAQVWFALPANAVPIDLGEDPAPRAARLRGTALPPAEREALVALQELLVEGLQAGGVGYAAHLVSTVGDRDTVAMLCVAVQPMTVGSDDVLDRVVTAVAAEVDQRSAAPLELPCGRAQLIVEDRMVDALGVGSVRAVRQAQIVVPAPDRSLLATFALSTVDVPDWDGWMALLGRVAATIAFTPPYTAPAGPTAISSALTA